ncbi:MAG: flagellar hook-basal body complex protein FliE [Thermotaleaceae bacterium]
MKISNVMTPTVTQTKASSTESTIGFAEFLKDSIHKVNELELNSQEMDQLLAVGEIDNIHDVMIAAQKADIAVQFTIEIKNKVIEAYKEIMRLQL